MKTNLSNPWHSLLKECYRRPHPLCLVSSRSYARNNGPRKEIAVLGSGITGLTAAYNLSQKLPEAHITLYEASSRVSGWIQSSHVDVKGGKVIFEQGPRTLRPGGASGMATLDLIRRLGLVSKVLITPKSSAAAQNRYIYYPDHLVRMPGPGQSYFEMFTRITTEPIFRGVMQSFIPELSRPPRERELEDESIGSFLRRRFGSQLTDNIVSAVLHGIYSGDIDKLSVKSVFPSLWHLETMSGSASNGSLIRTMISNVWNKRLMIQQRDLDFLRSINSEWHDGQGRLKQDLQPFRNIMDASVYTFREGLEQLSTALVDHLDAAPNVSVENNARVTGATLETSGKSQSIGKMIHLTSVDNQKPKSPTQKVKPYVREFHDVISTLAQPPIISANSAHASFEIKPESDLATSMATVMVVNLHFRSSSVLPVRGFGYLLPRSLPFLENPERALGVVFDSDATPEQDTAPGTKLTVMMGGHWWDGWSEYPNEHEGLSMARAVLERHLGIKDEPDAWKVTLQKDCIPQYHVGHTERLRKLDRELDATFGGQLRVAGAGFHGVSVNDCVRSGYVAADQIVKGLKGTGLGKKGEEWVLTGGVRQG